MRSRKRPVNFRPEESRRQELFAVAKELGVSATDVLNRGLELSLEEARAKLAETAEEEQNQDQERVRRAARGLSDEPVNVNDVRAEQLAERPSWQGQFTSPMAAAWSAGRPVWSDAEKRRAGKFVYYSPRPAQRHLSYGQRKVERLLGALGQRRQGVSEMDALPPHNWRVVR